MVVTFFDMQFGPSHPLMLVFVRQTYTSHILNHYGVRTTVVFDGYGSSTSTKQAEQRRRAEKCTSSDIIFDENMPTTTTQTAFLANSKNKQRLIEMVSEKMRMAGIRVIQAEADADTLIVSTALTVAEKERVQQRSNTPTVPISQCKSGWEIN